MLPVTSIGVVGTNETPVHDYQASQVHISFGNTVSDIIVTWVTANQTENSVVEYGIDELVNTAYGNQTLFIDGGTEKRRFYIHTVLLHNLKQNQTYS